MKRLSTILCCFAFLVSSQTMAVQISWTDWVVSNDGTSANGQIVSGNTIIDVLYSGTGLHNFVSTGTGTNYWTGDAYTQGGIENVPPAAEMIALNQGGTVTLTFSQQVEDIYLGLISWNRNEISFDETVEVASSGRGYWGIGSATLNAAQDSLVMNGEFHGVLKVDGNYTTLSFEHLGENWHGLTVGIGSVADVPAPSSSLLVLIAALGLFARRQINHK